MTSHEYLERVYLEEVLKTAERNNKIARQIQVARRHVLLMVAALLAMEIALLWRWDSRSVGFALAIAAFATGYAIRAIIGHLRRT